MKERQPGGFPFGSSCYRATAQFIQFRNRSLGATLQSDEQYSAHHVKERSKKTESMNRAVIGVTGGVLGGAAGGAITGTIAGSDEQTTQPQIDNEKGVNP